MNYKQHEIIRTNTTTDIYRPMPFGRSGHYRDTAWLYEIDGELARKDRGEAPFITTIKQAKEYINQAIEADQERIAHEADELQQHQMYDDIEENGLW